MKCVRKIEYDFIIYENGKTYTEQWFVDAVKRGDIDRELRTIFTPTGQAFLSDGCFIVHHDGILDRFYPDMFDKWFRIIGEE